MATHRNGDFHRNSTARMADETPAPQRLPAEPPTVSPERLRQLAADRRRAAKAMEKHIPAHDTTSSRFARKWVSRLREEAREFDRRAKEVQP